MGCRQAKASTPEAVKPSSKTSSEDKSLPETPDNEDARTPKTLKDDNAESGGATTDAVRDPAGEADPVATSAAPVEKLDRYGRPIPPTGSTYSPAPAPVAPAAGESVEDSGRRPSRSSKRVSFHEAQPELIVNTPQLEQRISQMQPTFDVGDRVEASDDGRNWKTGVVTDLNPLQVQPDGKKTSFEWRNVRHYIEPSNEDEELSDLEASPPQAVNNGVVAAPIAKRPKDTACC